MKKVSATLPKNQLSGGSLTSWVLRSQCTTMVWSTPPTFRGSRQVAQSGSDPLWQVCSRALGAKQHHEQDSKMPERRHLAELPETGAVETIGNPRERHRELRGKTRPYQNAGRETDYGCNEVRAMIALTSACASCPSLAAVLPRTRQTESSSPQDRSGPRAPESAVPDDKSSSTSAR